MTALLTTGNVRWLQKAGENDDAVTVFKRVESTSPSRGWRHPAP